MNTTFVGVKELRQNMAKTAERARKKNERIIVLRKNKPIFELRPLSDEDALVESFRRDIEEAREDVRTGRTYTHDEMKDRLGL